MLRGLIGAGAYVQRGDKQPAGAATSREAIDWLLGEVREAR